MIAGCDEAGAGPGFGDLVASAVILTTPIEELTDSKKLSEKKRDAYFKQITETCIFGIGRVSNVEIDQHGLAWARRIVFHRALDDMMTRTSTLPESIIVDGTIFDLNDVLLDRHVIFVWWIMHVCRYVTYMLPVAPVLKIQSANHTNVHLTEEICVLALKDNPCSIEVHIVHPTRGVCHTSHKWTDHVSLWRQWMLHSRMHR